MSYSRRLGRRPMEQASKVAHGHVINDPAVAKLLARCALPRRADDIDLSKHIQVAHELPSTNPIRHIVAVDSGYTEVAVRNDFPSATMCFFQFGALTFKLSDLERLEKSRFIDPEDIAKLKRIERLKLALPVKNIALSSERSLTASVRRTLFEFFAEPLDGTSLLDTLQWFLFEEYGTGVDEYLVASCPECGAKDVPFRRATVAAGRVPCDRCKAQLYLTDAFRLHEAIDDYIGASGVLGYITTLLEQLVMAHCIRLMLLHRPPLLRETLFIKDGPLAFFGQTANMHGKMRTLIRFLAQRHSVYMAGLEKSGAFVDHAAEVAQKLSDGTVLVLDNEYIYRYIIPGTADPSSPYGRTTYYGSKVIFRSRHAGVYVVTIPTVEPLASPRLEDLINASAVLTNIEKLKCDMYDDALIPIALANRLVSLANRPSAAILQRFAIEAMGE